MPTKQVYKTEYATISKIGKNYNVGIPYKLSLKPGIKNRLPFANRMLGLNNWVLKNYTEASYIVYCALELKKELQKKGEY